MPAVTEPITALRRNAGIAALLLLLLRMPALAEQQPAPGGPQLNGPPAPGESFSREAPPGAHLPDDPRIIVGVWTMRTNEPPPRYELKPAYVGKFPAWEPMRMGGPPNANPATLCTPRDIFAGGTYPTEIFQTSGQITIINEENHRIRRIYLDGRPHPAHPVASYSGHSIGHWDGDTLIVDTVAIRPPPDSPQPPGYHLVERFRRLPGGRVLEQQLIADSAAYLKPTVQTVTYNWRPDLHLQEEICEENEAIYEHNYFGDKSP